MRDMNMKRNSLRAQAKQAFDAEMLTAKAGDCPDAVTTYEMNTCYAEEASITDGNLKAYEGAIRDLLGLGNGNSAVPPPRPGPSGPELTPEEHVAEFDRVEQSWHTYLDTAAAAAVHQFGGGTGGPSFGMECHLRLVRSHMKELNRIYGLLLRL
jgi:uncharacterized protein YecT (DUF1311 family)